MSYLNFLCIAALLVVCQVLVSANDDHGGLRHLEEEDELLLHLDEDELLRHLDEDELLRHLEDEDELIDPPTLGYSQLVSTDYQEYALGRNNTELACIKVENGTVAEGQPLILSDCNDTDTDVFYDGWRLDVSFSLIHSQLDDGYCMQASRGSGMPSNGNRLRLFPCDATKMSQRFVYRDGIGIRPLFNQSLCVVWQGVLPDIDEDWILLNPCQEVGGRFGWDFVGTFFEVVSKIGPYP